MTKVRALSSTLDSHFHTLVRSQEQQISHNLSYSGRKKKNPAAHWILKTPPCFHQWSHHMWPGVRFHDGVSYFIPWHRDLGIFREKNPCLFSFSSHYFWNFCHITFFLITLEITLFHSWIQCVSVSSIQFVLKEIDTVIHLYNTFLPKISKCTVREI